MDVFKALRMAIRSEVAAQKMYVELAEGASDAEVRSLFDYLAEYETAHQNFLEAELKALAAAQKDKRGMPSHWLRLLREEVGADLKPAGTDTAHHVSTDRVLDSDLAQMRLSLSAAEAVAKVLRNANEELSQKQARYEQELAIAADIQRKLLPQELPQNTGLQIAAANVMARPVGGDYYDLITNQQGELALVVGDSMGKGIPASLLMTTVRAIWRSQGAAAGSRSPGQMLDMINRTVYPDLKAAEAFMTMFNALYDPATSMFRYSSAGHNPPFLRSASAPVCKELDIGGPPVGMFPDSEFPGDEFLMRQGDIAVIYTDGVVEATDANNELFGIERLCSLINQHCNSDAEEVKNAILSEVDLHTGSSPQADDITVVVLKKV